MAAKRRVSRQPNRELAKKVPKSLKASSNTEAVTRALRKAIPTRGTEAALEAKRRESEDKGGAKEDAGGLPQIGCVGEEVGEMGRSGNYPQIPGHQPERRLLISKLV